MAQIKRNYGTDVHVLFLMEGVCAWVRKTMRGGTSSKRVVVDHLTVREMSKAERKFIGQ